MSDTLETVCMKGYHGGDVIYDSYSGLLLYYYYWSMGNLRRVQNITVVVTANITLNYVTTSKYHACNLNSDWAVQVQGINDI